jgi:SAM-dependent methyltransferase
MKREKVRGPVEFGALRNPLLGRVLTEFGAEAFRRCSVMMEFEAFLRSVLDTHVGREAAMKMTCLEIGSYNGISALVLAQYFRRVVCVSIDDRPGELLKHRIVAALGLENIDFVDAENNDEKAEIIHGLDFQFCYQDGDHLNDTHGDFDLVKRCGRVLLHEYWPLQPAVWNLVNELPQEEITRAQFDCLAYWHGRENLG